MGMDLNAKPLDAPWFQRYYQPQTISAGNDVQQANLQNPSFP